ncbi:MAG TPA: helicase-related protein, partial [Polyangiaceae bacterium]|nr:helicase-related protein [Polyangiaceae bacterium]
EEHASAAERAALAALHAATLHNMGRKRSQVDHLFRWTLIKAFLSSPQACLESIDHRVDNVAKAVAETTQGPHPHAATLRADLEQLGELRRLVEQTAPTAHFSKLQRLFKELEAIGFDGSAESPRVVIFSERIRTLEHLQEQLAQHFQVKRPEAVIQVFEASLPDQQLKELKESFGRESSPVRVLLASDAASEGVNLHYHCHHLLHFDIPWSLIRLTQRNGRIDRFGQRHTPHLHYLLTQTDEQTADHQVVRRLIERESVVYLQLGDAGALLGLYDAESEDERITQGVAQGEAVNDIIPDRPRAANVPNDTSAMAAAPASETDLSKPEGGLDLFSLLDSEPPAASTTQAEGTPAAVSLEPAPDSGPAIDVRALLDQISPPTPRRLVDATTGLPTLFDGDYHFAVTALRQLEKSAVLGSDKLEWNNDDDRQCVRIYAPPSFSRFREEFLPREAVPKPNEAYQLTASQDVIFEKIRQALESDDGEWPEWQLLWEQHPLMEWMLDALSAAYARNEAPLLLTPQLGQGRALYLFSTLVSNEESQPVHTAWFSVEAKGERVGTGTLDLPETFAATGFAGTLSNPNRVSKRAAVLKEGVPAAVGCARAHVDELRKPLLDEHRKQARRETRRLNDWAAKVEETLKSREERYRSKHGKLALHHERALNQERENQARFKESHQKWLQSLSAHGAAFVRLVAAFTGE